MEADDYDYADDILVSLDDEGCIILDCGGAVEILFYPDQWDDICEIVDKRRAERKETMS